MMLLLLLLLPRPIAQRDPSLGPEQQGGKWGAVREGGGRGKDEWRRLILSKVRDGQAHEQRDYDIRT